MVAAERFEGPQLRLDADRVGVAGEQDRLLGRVGRPQPRDQVRLAGRRGLDDVDLEAEGAQPRREQLGHLRLVAGRVARVHLDQLPQERHHLALLRLRRARREEERHHENRHDPSHAPGATRSVMLQPRGDRRPQRRADPPARRRRARRRAAHRGRGDDHGAAPRAPAAWPPACSRCCRRSPANGRPARRAAGRSPTTRASRGRTRRARSARSARACSGCCAPATARSGSCATSPTSTPA